MAASVMSSLSLKPSPLIERSAPKGLPSLARSSSSLRIEASAKKIKTDKPYGTGGGMNLRDGLDASGRKPKGKGVYQFVDKYGANVDGYRYHWFINMGCYPCWHLRWGCPPCLLHKCFESVKCF
ncbi:photosystem II 10 kDa polypeptide, chloroplastic isoform X2 [Telopea speciosissima]|uniref:photosystem II 10 kDa polypeptide, chloroplastic isoform X2 n=1 Tax=Telopea speciosissima TaxID=54955 RepID=UPI001CC5AB49|nr:photosystem II 10 kDa polypeptide, chloroplastic isoform X2 [Telopea speciosissima]